MKSLHLEATDISFKSPSEDYPQILDPLFSRPLPLPWKLIKISKFCWSIRPISLENDSKKKKKNVWV